MRYNDYQVPEDTMTTDKRQPAERARTEPQPALLPPDERPVMKWNSNPFIVDGGGSGNGEDDGAAFLLPYWMGRYHKFVIGE